MKLLQGFQSIAELEQGSVASIGNFDGVHRGHQALLNSLKQKANQLKLPLVIILFEPQPREFFLQQEAPARLSRLREKLLMLKQHGVDYVYCIRFNKSVSEMPAATFAEKYIFLLFNVKYLLVGQDFHFGKGRTGELSLLQSLGQTYDAQVEGYPDFLIDQERVSSTKIRYALAHDQLDLAKQLLGRPYSMCGRVIKGYALGRQWGVPTANLPVYRKLLPLQGIYCVQVKRQGKPIQHGVASIGNRPTLDGENKNMLEIHLFDFDESIYGEMLQVFFLHKLRDEVKFPSMQALIDQIHEDVALAKAYFN